ncbi:MAG: M20/M25/M40 family metallo-hydrolase [Gemmatimonadota bacterium]
MSPRIAGVLVVAAAPMLALSAACGPTAEAGPAAALRALAGDSAAILDDLRFLSADALGGRGTGSEGSRTARDYLVAGFAEAGIQPLEGAFEHTFTWTRRGQDQERTGVNVLGIVPGTEIPGRFVVLSAHYDHVGIRDGVIFNGADDNASGAVGLLALARAVRSRPLRHSLVVAAWDAEEVGLRGARAFVSRPPVPLESVAVNLNLDMIARTGGVLWAGGAAHTPALRPILEAVAEAAPVELRLGHDQPDAPEGDDWTGSSDHGAFHGVGIPFVYLGVEDHEDVHQPTDDFENVAPGEYMNALRTALLTLLALDQELSPTQEPGS